MNGIAFKKHGDYAFNLLVNGETKKTLSLRVNEPMKEKPDWWSVRIGLQ